VAETIGINPAAVPIVGITDKPGGKVASGKEPQIGALDGNQEIAHGKSAHAAKAVRPLNGRSSLVAKPPEVQSESE